MKVVFIPDYRKGNPYQKDLADSLSKEGVIVNFGTIVGTSKMPSAFWRWRKIDILHLHWQHPFLLANNRIKTVLRSACFISGLLLLKLFRVRIVWTVHNIINLEGRHRRLELLFSKLVARLCNKIIVHCPSAKKAVIEAYGLKKDCLIECIPHGNYIDSHENNISKTQARNHLQLNNEDLVFLCFGLLRRYRGIPELIDAFKRLNFTKGKLLIVGQPHDNGLAQDILRRCSGINSIRTIFEFIPHDEAQIYVNSADIVIYTCDTSFFSPCQMPGGVILGMSFAKPLIAPAIGCIPDVLDAEGSFLYDPSDKEGLLKAMQLALGADLTEMGNHNLQLAKQLQWDDIAKKTFNIYEKCLGE